MGHGVSPDKDVGSEKLTYFFSVARVRKALPTGFRSLSSFDQVVLVGDCS